MTSIIPPLPRDLKQHVIYARNMGRAFGEIAIDLRLLRAVEVKELLREQEERGGRIGEIAVHLGLLQQSEVDRVLSAQAMTISVDARHAAAPQFLTWVNDLKVCGIAPEIKRVTAQDIETLRREQPQELEDQDADLATLSLARRLFTEAAAIHCTDVTILIRDTHAEVQMRIKGDVKVASVYTMKRAEGHALIRSIYTGLSTDKHTYIPKEFQDAQINGDVFPGCGLSSIRIIRGPAYPVAEGGGFLVARLQYRKDAVITVKAERSLELKKPHTPFGRLNIAGLTASQIELIERLVRTPMGVALVTGPTGSGKTTTLYELMKYQAQIDPQTRQITIENPPEIPSPQAIQLSSGHDDQREYVRYVLRMDPDIIHIGEIRRADEAVAALQAAETGHFVWSTLHTTDPYKVLTRLTRMDPQQLSLPVLCDHELLVGLMAQRVVPMLCPDCKAPLVSHATKLPDFMRIALESWGDLSAASVRGPGCKTCAGDGIVSRQAVAEIVLTSAELMEDVLEHGIATARKRHRMRAGSDRSMLANAMDLVFTGEIDPVDVHKHVHSLQIKEDGV